MSLDGEVVNESHQGLRSGSMMSYVQLLNTGGMGYSMENLKSVRTLTYLHKKIP